MKLEKLGLLLVYYLLTGAIVLPASSAKADSPIQRITASQAQGLTGSIPTITVWAGAGANLNFIPTGEIVKKVWLDDPSQIVLDFDGSMCMAAQGNNCSDSSATVVHLKRINPIEFPSLPRTSSTLLSVVTETQQGERRLYQFRIAYGEGKPQYHAVAIQPDSYKTPVIKRDSLLPARLADIARGLQIAKSKKLLGANQGNQRLERRVQNFMVLARNGQSLQSAAQQAGVSVSLIQKLVELGRSEPRFTVSFDPVSSPALPSSSVRKTPLVLPNRQHLSQPSSLVPINSLPSSNQASFSHAEPLDAATSAPTATVSQSIAIAPLPKQPPNPPAAAPNQQTVSGLPPATGSQSRAIASIPKQSPNPPAAAPTQQVVPNSDFSFSEETLEKFWLTNDLPASGMQTQPTTVAQASVSSVLSGQTSITASSSTSSTNHLKQAIDDANAAAFGLVVANQKGQIEPHTTMWRKAQSAILWLRRGNNRESAARSANMPVSVLSQLIEWGQNRP